MSNVKPTYAETFMSRAGVKTGSDTFRYLTLKMPVLLDGASADKAWDTSNCVAFIWNRFTEHQIHAKWRDSYETIKKLLPGIKADYPELKSASSQVLQEVAKSHSAATKSCRTKRKRKMNDDPHREPNTNFPGFKSRKHFHSHKYPQQGISFELNVRKLRLAYGKKPSDWIEGSLPHEINESSVKCVTLTHDEKNGFSVSLETVFELPRHNNNSHSLVMDPCCKTALTCLRSDGTVWEYDISDLWNLNLKIYQRIDELLSRREVLPCARKLAIYLKAKKSANEFLGPMPKTSIRPVKPVLSREYRRVTSIITKLFASMRNRSKQYLHTMANRILKDHPMVSTIHIGGGDRHKTIDETKIWAKHEAINRAIQNNNPLGRLIEFLKYKAAFQAKKVEEFVDRGTTETCSECDHVGEPAPTKQPAFKCGKCGFIAPVDINATRYQTKIVAYGKWHALKHRKVFSSVRTTLAALSCVNSHRLRAQVSLTTGRMES
jgi:transposase